MVKDRTSAGTYWKKVFNGKTYSYDGQFKLKSEAEKSANELRSRGKKARITHGARSYIVWRSN